MKNYLKPYIYRCIYITIITLGLIACPNTDVTIASQNTSTESSQASAPSAPSFTLGTPTFNSIPLTITAPTNTGLLSDGTTASINNYLIQYNTVNSFSSSNFRTTTISTEGKIFIYGLSPDTTYHIRVRSVNTNDDTTKRFSPFTTSQNASTESNQATAPDIPTFTLGTPSLTSIPLTITAPTNTGLQPDGTPSNINHYSIEYDTVDTFDSPNRQDTTAPSTAGQTSIEGLYSGTTYHIRVRSVSNNIDTTKRYSPFTASQNISTTTSDQATAPSVPSFTLGTPSLTSIPLTITASTGTGVQPDGTTPAYINYYSIEYDTVDTFDSPNLITKTVLTAGKIFISIGINANTTYHIRVRSVSTNNDTTKRLSPYTTSQSISTQSSQATTPDVPSFTLGTPTFTSIPLTITAPTNTGLQPDGTTPASIDYYELEYDIVDTFDSSKLKGNPVSTAGQISIGELRSDTTYHIRIRAVSTNNDASKRYSPYTASQNISTKNSQATTPSPPSFTLGIPTFDSISLTITAPTNTGLLSDGAPANIDYYVIEYDTVNTFDSFPQARFASTAGQTSIGILKPGTTYHIRVRSVNTNNDYGTKYSTYTASKSISTRNSQATAPNAPSFTLGTPTFNSIPFTITAPTNAGVQRDGTTPASINFYVIQYDTVNTFDSPTVLPKIKIIYTAGQNSIEGLNSGTTYHIRVRSVSNNNDYRTRYSTFTASQNIPTESSQTSAPGVPSFTLGTPTFNSIPLTITAPANTGLRSDGTTPASIDHYDIQYDTVDTFNSPNLQTKPVSTAGQTFIEGLNSGTTYHMRVRAVSNDDDTSKHFSPYTPTQNTSTESAP